MIRLFTTWYPETNPERAAEYVECLRRNLECPSFSEVLVIVEGAASRIPESPKLRTRALVRRPYYQDFFEWINEVAGPDDISIVANTDIWFGREVAVVDRALGSRECFALARWDDGGLFDRNDSQDAWIVRGKVSGLHGDFPIGVPRCDNRILYELQSAGYSVRNPAFSIVARHVHAGGRGEYTTESPGDYVAPPYRYLWPHNLWSLPKTRWHNLRNADERVEWRMDSRRAAASLPGRILLKIRRLVASAGE